MKRHFEEEEEKNTKLFFLLISGILFHLKLKMFFFFKWGKKTISNDN